jgi:DnaJ-class molecular chaperone
MDPFSVLEIEPCDDDEAIRAAYFGQVRRFPPDREPEQFRRVREAWEMIRDRDQRFALRVFGPKPYEDPVALIDLLPPVRRFAGPARWLAVIKETRR